MKKIIGLAVLTLAAVNTGYAQQEIGVAKFHKGLVQHVVYADKTQWKPCPPTLPKNCQMAVFEGNPKKSDLFTIRFHTPQNFFMPAHTHPKDERVTLIKGKAAVAFGADATREDATEFGPGDYYINARNAVHKVWLEKGTVLQITGIGPWKANYLDQH